MPEMLELAKFAKHHIPQDHELDDEDFVDKRIYVSRTKKNTPKSNIGQTEIPPSLIYLKYVYKQKLRNFPKKIQG